MGRRRPKDNYGPPIRGPIQVFRAHSGRFAISSNRRDFSARALL